MITLAGNTATITENVDDVLLNTLGTETYREIKNEGNVVFIQNIDYDEDFWNILEQNMDEVVEKFAIAGYTAIIGIVGSINFGRNLFLQLSFK